MSRPAARSGARRGATPYCGCDACRGLRAVDHDALPLGLAQAVAEQLGETEARQVAEILGPLPRLSRTINRGWPVGTLAISSRDGRVTYVDCDMPVDWDVKRRDGGSGDMSPLHSLNEHEEVEWELMNAGWEYLPAHRVATIAERLVVEAAGWDWLSYEGAADEQVKLAEGRPNPPDAFLKTAQCRGHAAPAVDEVVDAAIRRDGRWLPPR